MKLKKGILLSMLGLTVMMSNQVLANDDITVVGTIPHTLKQHQADSISNQELIKATTSDKVIQLLKVKLSEQAKAELLLQAKYAAAHQKQFALTVPDVNAPDLPSKIELGMSKVPVLDQGQHGTCVTFAITAAMDAIINKGDYVSQLCSLQLGTYLVNNGYSQYSGWYGSWPINVINQLEEYGVVSKSKQHKKGCGDLYHYPTSSSHSSDSFMTPDAYHALSEPMFGTVMNWSDLYVAKNSVQTLQNVKDALNSGNRVVFGVLLPRDDLGTAGAVGKRNTWVYEDTWVLTQKILDGVSKANAAHEMIITGYDDNAVSVDDKGKKHKGLLIIRNSWSKWLGDWGDFYMSYDYFKLLALDVKSISSNS